MSDHVFDVGRWQSQPFFYQMGNIASEVGRAFSAQRRGDKVASQAAFFRGLDLIDATVQKLTDEKSPRLKELLRAREVFAENIAAGADDGVEKYFMEYAVAARSTR